MEEYLPLIEFSYNNSYQSTIQRAPFETHYGRKYRTPLCWSEMEEALIIGPELIQETTKKYEEFRSTLRLHKLAKRAMQIKGEDHWSSNWGTKCF